MSRENLNNNQLPFRPLDNSMSTQTKYELEAQHWFNAQKSVINRNTNTGLSIFGLIIGIFQFLFGAFAFVFNLFSLLFLICSDSYKRWSDTRRHELEHKRYMQHLDGVIARSPIIKGYETPDEDYLED